MIHPWNPIDTNVVGSTPNHSTHTHRRCPLPGNSNTRRNVDTGNNSRITRRRRNSELVSSNTNTAHSGELLQVVNSVTREIVLLREQVDQITKVEAP